MKIDLNQILASLQPDPVTIAVDGQEYSLAITLASAAAFDVSRTAIAGEKAADQIARVIAAMKSAFVAVTPPFLDEPFPADRAAQLAYNAKFYALMGAIGAVIEETLSPKAQVQSAKEKAIAQMEAPEPPADATAVLATPGVAA